MGQPINYILDVKTPFQAATEGYKVGLAGQEALAQRQALEAQRAKALADAEALRVKAQRAADAKIAIDDLINNKNAGPEDYRRVAAALPDEERNFLLQAGEGVSKERARADALANAEIMSTLVAGQTDKTFNKLTERVAGLTNSGRQDEARVVQSMIDLGRINPKNLQNILGVYMAVNPESDKLLDRAATATKPEEKTMIQRNYEWIAKNFGEEAANEHLQFGSAMTSLPLGKGKGTFVGPVKYAPGVVSWKKQNAQQAMPSGEEVAPEPPKGIDFILNQARQKRRIDQATLDTLNQSFGQAGQKQLNQWLLDNSVRVIVRRGYSKKTGQSIIEFSDGKIEYGTD